MAINIQRREFIGALGDAAAWPLAVRAQQPPMPVAGFLGGGSPDMDAKRVGAFHQGLAWQLPGRNRCYEMAVYFPAGVRMAYAKSMLASG
jgi:hypothetical protein